MTIHYMRDYSANPKTAANNVYPPEAPMFEDVPEDWLDAAFHRVPEPEPEPLPPMGLLVGGTIGAFVALVILSVLPVGVW